MNTKANKVAETPKNYSDEMVSELTEFGTHNLDSAKFFAEKFGKSYQSIISKVKSLDLPYEKKIAAPKKAKETTKAELVETIEKRLEIGRAHV